MIMDYLPCQCKIHIQKLIFGQKSLFFKQILKMFALYDILYNKFSTKYCQENILPTSK